MRVWFDRDEDDVQDQDRRNERPGDGRRERHGGAHGPPHVEHVELEPEHLGEGHRPRADDLHEETDGEADRDEADAYREPGSKALREPLPQREAEQGHDHRHHDRRAEIEDVMNGRVE